MGWAALRLYTLAVYGFMFLPVAVVVLLSFNASQFGSFPMTGFSARWFVELAQNDAILRAFRTSLILGALTALISTTLGVLAALALVRYRVPGETYISTLLIAPILVIIPLSFNAENFSEASQICHPTKGRGIPWGAKNQTRSF